MAAKGQSPYSIGIAPSSIDFDLDPTQQMRKYKREEKDARSPHVLPYEMGELPQYFANMVENGVQASRTIENILKSENFEHREELAKLKNNVEKAVVYLMKTVDPLLSKFTIGQNLEETEKKD
jgi:predicted ATPase